MTARVRLRCSWCNAPVVRYQSQVKTTNFCDRSCQGRYRAVHRTGPNAANWRGGVKYDRRRVLIYTPSHPRADKKGYVPRAWLVVEEWRGRPIQPGEVVHHEDDDPANDEPVNLQVLPSKRLHARLHALPRRMDAAGDRQQTGSKPAAGGQ